MAMSDVDARREVRQLRLDLADRLADLEPEAWELPSWCQGWRLRDVLGHLVQNAEATRSAMFWQIARNPVRPDRLVDRLARQFGDRPVPELLDRLRQAADRHYHLPGTPPALGVGDLLVHSADVLRPVGVVVDPPLVDVLLVLDTYAKWGRKVFHAVPHSGVSLTANDADWRTGEGPEVSGTAYDLLLLMANRHQVVHRLEGPGVKHLAI
jgi:uncharacterized protein (TIGR03083 family)